MSIQLKLSLTSHSYAEAVPPVLVISAATVSACVRLMSKRHTEAPFAANWWAIARPMPLPAPVITAMRPSNLKVSAFNSRRLRDQFSYMTFRPLGSLSMCSPAIEAEYRCFETLPDTSMLSNHFTDLIRNERVAMTVSPTNPMIRPSQPFRAPYQWF